MPANQKQSESDVKLAKKLAIEFIKEEVSLEGLGWEHRYGKYSHNLLCPNDYIEKRNAIITQLKHFIRILTNA